MFGALLIGFVAGLVVEFKFTIVGKVWEFIVGKADDVGIDL